MCEYIFSSTTIILRQRFAAVLYRTRRYKKSFMIHARTLEGQVINNHPTATSLYKSSLCAFITVTEQPGARAAKKCRYDRGIRFFDTNKRSFRPRARTLLTYKWPRPVNSTPTDYDWLITKLTGLELRRRRCYAVWIEMYSTNTIIYPYYYNGQTSNTQTERGHSVSLSATGV